MIFLTIVVLWIFLLTFSHGVPQLPSFKRRALKLSLAELEAKSRQMEANMELELTPDARYKMTDQVIQDIDKQLLQLPNLPTAYRLQLEMAQSNARVLNGYRVPSHGYGGVRARPRSVMTQIEARKLKDIRYY